MYWPETLFLLIMRRPRGGDRGSGPRLKNHENIAFLSNSGPEPLENHKAVETAFNVIVVFGYFLPSST